MNSFLDRMAARATGAVAEVAPRVPALFETTATVSAAPPAARVDTAPPAPDHELGLPVAGPQPVPLGPAGPRAKPDTATSAPAANPSTGPAEKRGTAGRLPVAADAGREHERAASIPQHVLAPAPAQLQSAVPLVQALPVEQPAPARAAAEPAVAWRGPDVIHVSIGRVDVRAPAPPPGKAPAAAATRPAPEPDRMSLQDYLRGQRGRR